MSQNIVHERFDCGRAVDREALHCEAIDDCAEQHAGLALKTMSPG